MSLAGGGVATGAPVDDERVLVLRHVDEALVGPVRALFDHGYYIEQSGLSAASRIEAFEHYLETGWHAGLDPHPLFDTRFYLEANPAARTAGVPPLLHYLSEGRTSRADPSPYFDTEYYFSQRPQAVQEGVNALVDYVKEGQHGRAGDPNPLFRNGFYLNANPGLRGQGLTPLAHYLRRGRIDRQTGSPVHYNLLRALRGSLLRGSWHRGNVVFFSRSAAGAALALATRDALVRELQHEARIVLVERPPGLDSSELPASAVALEDFLDEELLRPSAVRFLALSLASDDPALAVGDTPEFLPGALKAGVPSYLLALDEETSGLDLGGAALAATRVIFGSRELFRLATGGAGGPYPANAAVRDFDAAAPDRFVSSLLELAERDGALQPAPARALTDGEPTRRILVPCSDWGISGVNSALEAVGRGLIERGWDLEIVFTRDRDYVEASLGDEGRLPDLPHRWLTRGRPGIEGMWTDLIAGIEAEAPCIVFAGYDFFANSVLPALTEEVGAVMWVQADDGDYYEQAYRLGRYCNAIACVSGRIRDHVASLQPPDVAERTHVIHNTSVRESDIVPRHGERSEKLRIVYTGRLVQYQKRILDFVALADELEALGLDFAIELIGTTPAHDTAALLLPTRAAGHLERGTIVMPGRLRQQDVLERLRASDLFVLLSDFEGLPLSLVEAMAAGCVPVVAEMESGIREVLIAGENGVIVPGRDYAEWARTIRDLWLDGTRLDAMSEQAQATVRRSFTIDRIAAEFDALFRKVADEIAAGYTRPPALTWGPRRAPFGDVLPPPPMHRAGPVAGLA